MHAQEINAASRRGGDEDRLAAYSRYSWRRVSQEETTLGICLSAAWQEIRLSATQRAAGQGCTLGLLVAAQTDAGEVGLHAGVRPVSDCVVCGHLWTEGDRDRRGTGIPYYNEHTSSMGLMFRVLVGPGGPHGFSISGLGHPPALDTATAQAVDRRSRFGLAWELLCTYLPRYLGR